MAEKNDDIKQLFTHLGLNPSDYQEIRNAARVPEVRTESVEAARRWSLLDSMASQPAAEPVAPTPLAAPVVIQVAVPAASPPSLPPVATPGRELSRAEIERESLQSFFEAVKEPLPSATLDVPQDGPSIPATIEIRGLSSTTIESSGVDEPAAARIADLVRSRWPAETAAAVAEGSSAIPAAATATAVQARSSDVAPAAGDARLRLSYGATPKTETPTADSLTDVFRRLNAAGRHR